MSIYHKYRPQSFEDMLGSEATLVSLKATIEKEDRPHVYLFTGDSGCGKTTAARICAKMVGADSSLGVIEINSSNNRGIETARSIQTEAEMMPMAGTAKAYILDEAHKATSDFQSAMLKLLEDTPAHCYFFICTTNPEKLTKPFKGRCSVFQFTKIEDALLLKLLRQTNRAEGADVSRAVMEKIVQVADGSARKSLVLLEACLNIDEETALKSLDTVADAESPETIELCRLLIDDKASWGSVSTVLKKMKEVGMDQESIRYAVMGYVSAVLLSGKDNRKAAACLDYFSEPFYNTGFPGLTLACYKTIFL